MSNLTRDIKKFLSVKFKPRDDSITDQYNRILMVKVLLAATFVTGLNWHKDDINCVISEKVASSKDVLKFAQQSCWINGFYVYEELKETSGFQGYYGLPIEIDHDGVYLNTPYTCKVNPRNPECLPMTKMFYLQYQYFPFFLAVLAILYYLPYAFFYRINCDLRSLGREIKKEKPDYEVIADTFFLDSERTNSQNIKIVLNILVKFGHLIAHILVFESIDYVIYGQFSGFFAKWIQWSGLENQEAFNYIGIRDMIKPGERMLPTFGFCDLLEPGADFKHTLLNEHKFVCELSQNIMYHYVLLALWVFIILGFAISAIGIVETIYRQCDYGRYLSDTEESAKKIYDQLSIRRRQYLDYVHKKNLERYGCLLRKLNEKMVSKKPVLYDEKGVELFETATHV